MKQLLKYILANTIEYQKIAETKHSITIALASGISLFVANFFRNSIINILAIVFCMVSVVISFVALCASGIVSITRLSSKTHKSLIYYKYICALSEQDYARQLVKKYNFPDQYSLDGFECDLVEQIVALSKRTNTKFVLFNTSIISLCIGIIFGVISVVV